MTACAYCHAPDGDLFTPNGDPVCQRCDAHFRAQISQHRAAAQANLDPFGAPLTFASPKKLKVVGLALMAGALALGAVETLLLGRVHLLFLGAMFLAGFAALARGSA